MIYQYFWINFIVILLLPLNVHTFKCQAGMTFRELICTNLQSEDEYFNELLSDRFFYGQYKGYSELRLINHPFVNELKLHIFNYTTKTKSIQFMRLQTLSITQGQLNSIASNAFKNFNNHITNLDLSMNKINSYPYEAVRSCPKLSNLNLSNNMIETLDKRLGIKIINVDLSSNSIHFINSLEVFSFPAINILNLTRNYLRTVSSKAISVKKLLLENNPLLCDCHLRWMIGKSEDDPVCASPNRLRGRTLSSLQADIVVCEPVIIQSSQPSYQLNEGDLLELMCSAYADPKPRIWWTSGNSVTIGKTLVDQSASVRHVISNFQSGLNITSKLRIEKLQMSDSGQIRCVASFEHPDLQQYQNETSKLFHLNVIARNHVRQGNIWIVAIVATVALLVSVCLAILLWIKWSKNPSESDQETKSETDHIVPNHCVRPILDLGPPMYSRDNGSIIKLLHDRPMSATTKSGDDLDITAYNEEYKLLSNDVQKHRQDYMKSPLLIQPRYIPSRSSTIGPHVSMGETEL